MSRAALRVSAPAGKATASVLFLHGLGDTGHGWSFLATDAHARPALQHVDFVLPHAPMLHISLMRDEAPAWFDLDGFGPEIGSSDVSGTLSSLAKVEDMIEAEIKRGVPANRIVLGGFSQGCALTHGTALVSKHKLAGFVCFSGFTPIPDELEKRATGINRTQPVFMGHGTSDPVVPLKSGKDSRDFLQNHGFTNVEWHSFPGLPHSVDLEEIELALKFLEKTIPKSTK